MAQRKKKDDQPESPKEKKQSQFIQIMNALFVDKNYIYNMTYEAAKQNIFMVLRRLAIKYPIEANVFNDGKVNPFDVLKFWSDYLYNGVSVPKWTYTGGAMKSKNQKNDLTSAQIKLYKKHFSLTDTEFDDAFRFFREQTINEVLEIADFYDQLEKIKKQS